MADQLDVNVKLGPLFTINVVNHANALSADTNSGFSVVINNPTKHMFTLGVGLKSTTYEGPPGPSGELFTTVALETLSALRLVALASGGVELVDPASIDSLTRMVGISTNASSVGSPITIKRSGMMSDPAWSWIPGQLLFCGPTGVLTTSIPTSIANRQVGVAVDTTTILINLSDLIILE